MVLKGQIRKTTIYVNETNLRGLFTEAASAEEEIILSNETTAVTTSTAISLLVKSMNKS